MQGDLTKSSKSFYFDLLELLTFIYTTKPAFKLFQGETLYITFI